MLPSPAGGSLGRAAERRRPWPREITLEQEVDRLLRIQAPAAPEELIWEPEPFEDQPAFASAEPAAPAEPEDPEESDPDETHPGVEDEEVEDEEED